MKKRDAMFGFGGLILGFLLATMILVVAERRATRKSRVSSVAHAAHIASILHDGRLEPLSEQLQQEVSNGIRSLGSRKLSEDDIPALRAVDKICRTRGIVLTQEANAVLVKNGARAE